MSEKILLVGGKGSGKTQLRHCMLCEPEVRTPVLRDNDLVRELNQAIPVTRVTYESRKYTLRLDNRDVEFDILDPRGGEWEWEGGGDSELWTRLRTEQWLDSLRFLVVCVDPATALHTGRHKRFGTLYGNVSHVLKNLRAELGKPLGQSLSLAIVYTKADSYLSRAGDASVFGRILSTAACARSLLELGYRAAGRTTPNSWRLAKEEGIESLLFHALEGRGLRQEARYTVERILENTWRLWADAMFQHELEAGISFHAYFTATEHLHEQETVLNDVQGVGVAELLEDFYDRYLMDFAWPR